MGLSQHEKVALMETLTAVNLEWEGFCKGVTKAGWQEAALRLDGLSGIRVKMHA